MPCSERRVCAGELPRVSGGRRLRQHDAARHRRRRYWRPRRALHLHPRRRRRQLPPPDQQVPVRSATFIHRFADVCVYTYLCVCVCVCVYVCVCVCVCVCGVAIVLLAFRETSESTEELSTQGFSIFVVFDERKVRTSSVMAE